MAEMGKGRQSRQRTMAARGKGTGSGPGVGGADSSGVRRSSSLGRLGNMRLPSLSLVEIDIESCATNQTEGQRNKTQSVDKVGENGACGSCFIAALPTPKDIALGLRRTSSFRRRPSLPLLEIMSDFGGVSSGRISPIERARSKSLSLSSSHNVEFSACSASASSSDTNDVSLDELSPLRDDTNVRNHDVKLKPTVNGVKLGYVNSSKEQENGIKPVSSFELKNDIHNNSAKENCTVSCGINKDNKNRNHHVSSVIHTTPDNHPKLSPCQQRHSAERKQNHSSESGHLSNDRLIMSKSNSKTNPSTPKRSHDFQKASSNSNGIFEGKPSKPNLDIASTSPKTNRDFISMQRRSSSLKRDFGRTTSPLQSHKNLGRDSPTLNYHDVFGNFSDVIRPASSTFDIGRTSSPVRFLPNNETSSIPNRASPKLFASPSRIIGSDKRNSPLLRSHSNMDFKTCLPRQEAASRSRRGSQSSQSSDGAREMLEAALEQMDDFIANNSCDSSLDDDRFSASSVYSGAVGGVTRLVNHASNRVSHVTGLVLELRHVLETTENLDDLKTHIPRDTLLVIRDWLTPDMDEIFSMVNVRSQHSEETVRRLEEDRHSLTLQVSVLTDQVEAQAEKIREMEMLMEEDKRRVLDANDILQQELLSRSHLESHQLELMSEVSGLKLRLASAEKDRRELDDRCRAAQRQVAELEAKLVMKDAENSELRMRLSRNGTLPLDSDNAEIEKLKRAVDTLMLANEEKERKMEDLRRLLRRYRRVEEILVQAQGRKAVEDLLSNIEDGDTSSNSSSTTPSVGDNLRPDNTPHASGSNHLSLEDRMEGRHYISSPSATSTPVHGSSETSRLNVSFHGTTSSNGSTPPVLSMGSNSRTAMGLTRSNSCENLVPGKAPPGKGDHNTLGGRAGGGSLISPGYGTLPKHIHYHHQLPLPTSLHQQHHHLLPPISNNSSSSSNHYQQQQHYHLHGSHEDNIMRDRELAPGPATMKRGHSSRGGHFFGLGRTLMRVRSGKRSCSAPNLAHSDVVTDDEDGLQHYGPGSQGEAKKRRGLRRLFGRLKRSSSQDLEGSRDRKENNPPGDFRRGGVRATATARLAWNRDVKGRISNPDIPFARWDTDRITAWFNDIGLNMYLVDCKRWVRNGEQLLRCSQQDLEKELGMKNSLHRKKLTLAMQAVSTSQSHLMEELDHNFVARWLDDIGLPQYKDSFYDARVDARMLNSLTVEDLFHLKVSSEVHHVSIRRGIQALRLNKFNPNALRRRPVPEEQQKQMDSIPGDVILWTNHRVMEWLRTIDLSEYAPNLRGSGVHGALMVLEPRFNSELFAVLLSIPASKTLLRRHLNSHFVGLIGAETQQKKREVESQSGFVPLLHNNKIKKGKFGLFNHKRSRSEPEMDSLICPPDLNGHQHNGKLPNEKAAKEIGVFSQEINSLTNMLSQERFMNSSKTSNV